MSFVADKQTLDDLNITGRYKGDSIFNLFDHTHTRGGGRVLEGMFQHPLTDAAAINTRSSIFRYFQEKETAFPTNRELCDAVEQYLSVAESTGRVGTTMGIAWKRLLHTMGSGMQYDSCKPG